MNEINKNTYYMLAPYFIRACMSISRARSGKYLLTNKDNSKGYWLVLSQGPISLKVPFRALFDINKKIAPIRSLSFSSAIYCPSAKRGLCQLDNQELTCYAKQGQAQASGKFITRGEAKGAPQINSLDQSFIVMDSIELIKKDDDLFYKLCQYINEYIPVVRFNLKGDFKDLSDYQFIIRLARATPRVFYYGYTARDDILSPMRSYQVIDRFYLNGSNQKYTNRFRATYDLKKWLTTSRICLGGCNKCKKCYSLKGKTIYCLVHGTNQDQDLNTWLNRTFICDLFNSLNSPDSPVLNPEDLQVYTGLLDSLNYQLANKLGIDLEFEDYWNLREWVHSLHYEVQDNIEQIRDYNKLQALGVA